MRVIFLCHQGLGDHILMNGLVHTFLKWNKSQLKELCIIARGNYIRKTLEHLYEDYPLVSFHWTDPQNELSDTVFQQLNQKPIGTIVHHNGNEYVGLNFGFHSVYHFLNIPTLPDHLSWVDYLYSFPMQMPSIHRITEFHLPSNLTSALERYTALCEAIGGKDYIVIHDDPGRNRNIDRNIVKQICETDAMTGLPVIYLGLGRYSYPLFEDMNNKDVGKLLEVDSLLDLFYILKNAKACHLMDSSVACLVDCSNIYTKLFLHAYLLQAESDGQSFTRDPWVRIRIH